MKIVREFSDLPREPVPVVLAAGFFDGVHRGHKRVIATCVRRARELGGQAWVLTFDSHPQKTIRPEAAPRLLTSTEHKLQLLRLLGLDGCLLLRFSPGLAALEPEEFLSRLVASAPGLR